MNISYDYHRDRAQFKRRNLSKKPRRMPRHAHTPRRAVKTILASCAIILVLGGLTSIALLGWLARDLPNPNRLIERSLPQSTRIYDRTGEVLLFQFHGDQQRTLVSLGDIPDMLKKATIVAEDKSFYTHKGFDLKGIVRAFAINLLRGGRAQGGSTITQQLIKNALLSSEKTFTRKFKELILAYRIEQSFTKDEILQLYLNEIPYGSVAYGVSAASSLYFDKPIHELSLGESAVLAVLPKAPTYYSPWGNNRDKLIARQQAVLDQMAEEGYITQEEARLAKAEKVVFREQTNSIRAPHFVMMVREQLSELFGDRLVEEGGLSVTTTLDYEKQKIAEEEVRAGAEKNKRFGGKNAALVSLDARTGEILAMVGSKDYFDTDIDGNVNVVLRPRQPGSSFKPIAYAAAFQKGFTPSTIVFDLKTNFDTTGEQPYAPQNYAEKEYGPVTMSRALAGSLNIAAVKTLYLAGIQNVLDLAQDLGYTTLRDRSRFGLSLVLGGGEVTLLEHTAASTAFAQEGVRAAPASILSVRDASGKTLHEFVKKTHTASLNPEVARTINAILKNQEEREYIFGPQNRLILSGREAAVKTGTTNDFRDAWTIGWTPSIATGVWVGNNDNSPMKKGSDGSAVAAPIWNGYMRRIHAGSAAEGFIRPASLVTGKPILDGIYKNNVVTRIDKRTGLPAAGTPFEDVEERVSAEVHDTLFWVNRDDPRGPAPQHPEQDPQFPEWERVVRAWVEREHVQESRRVIPPTVPQNEGAGPLSLSIISPRENDTIAGSLLRIVVSLEPPDDGVTVDYYLDTKKLGTKTEEPYELFTTLGDIDNGFRMLRVVATDKEGRIQEAKTTINILLP